MNLSQKKNSTTVRSANFFYTEIHFFIYFLFISNIINILLIISNIINILLIISNIINI